MKTAITAAVAAGLVWTTFAAIGAYVTILAILDRAGGWWRYNAPVAGALVALAVAVLAAAGWTLTCRNYRRTRELLAKRRETLRQVIAQRDHYKAIAEQAAAQGCARCRDGEVLRRNTQRLTPDERMELDDRFDLLTFDVAVEFAAKRKRGERP